MDIWVNRLYHIHITEYQKAVEDHTPEKHLRIQQNAHSVLLGEKKIQYLYFHPDF